MNYPQWLPYPRCIGRSALTLLGFAISVAVIVLLFMLGWRSWEIFPNLLDPDNMTQYQFNRAMEGMIEFSVLLGIFGFVIFPIIAMIWIRKIVETIGLAIKKEPIQWALRPRHYFQGIGDLIICYFSVLVAFILSSIIIDAIEGTGILDDLFIGIIFITQSYCYYGRCLMHEGREAASEKRQQNRQVADQWREYKRQGRENRQALDPVESELNQMKREEQRQLREKQRVTQLQQQAEKRRQKQTKPQPQKPTPKASRPKKKPAVAPDFPEEFLEPEVQEGLDSVDAELERIRKKMNNQS